MSDPKTPGKRNARKSGTAAKAAATPPTGSLTPVSTPPSGNPTPVSTPASGSPAAAPVSTPTDLASLAAPTRMEERESLDCLIQLVQDFGSTLDLDEVLENVAEGIKCVVDYDTFAVLLLDELGQQLYFHFAVGFSDDVKANWRFGLGQGLVGTAAARQQILRVGDVGSDPRYINAAPGVVAEMAIPLVVKNRTIGVLDVASRTPDIFTADHQRLLTFLAGHLANGIENSRLYDSVRGQARTLSLLHEVSRELTSILDREKLFNKIATLVKRLIDYQMFSVMLWNSETQLLEPSFMLREDERFTKKRGFPLGHGVSGTVAALRQPMRIPNVHLNPHYADCGHGVEVRSELAIPLVFKDRLIGVLDLESVEYNAFTEQHEQMLSTLGSYIAVALENSRLYEKVTEDEQRLDTDLRMAREIQKGLLPQHPPVDLGLDVGFAYKPARQLGGDFYDILPYGDGRLAFAVGDAAGKGAAAALHASLAIGTLRSHVVEHPTDPADMLMQMNRQLGEHGPENRFVAMAFGLFDSDARTMILANAGFTRPILVRDGSVDEIPVQGTPLGLLTNVSYTEQVVRLLPGDIIVFCSDGINESVNSRCEEFGTRRLKSLLGELADRPAQEIVDQLLETTERFGDEALRDSDDRTILLLKVR